MASFPPFGNTARIGNMYLALLQRAADTAGFYFWVNQFGNGIPLTSLANSLIGTPEYQGKNGTLNDEQFINMVYWNVLGRAPEVDGLQFWLFRLSTGGTRGEVVSTIIEQQEAFDRFATVYVNGYHTS